jgi:hypothetical protein
MAKIIERVSLYCVPGGRESILATLDQEGFELESMSQQTAGVVPRGALLIRRSVASGATPIVPKNDLSTGTTTPCDFHCARR